MSPPPPESLWRSKGETTQIIIGLISSISCLIYLYCLTWLKVVAESKRYIIGRPVDVDSNGIRGTRVSEPTLRCCCDGNILMGSRERYNNKWSPLRSPAQWYTFWQHGQLVSSQLNMYSTESRCLDLVLSLKYLLWRRGQGGDREAEQSSSCWWGNGDGWLVGPCIIYPPLGTY